MSIVLHQFEFSHFNDKVRWALAFKGIEHSRRSYLPGPHMRPIRRLSGQQQTPVLALGQEVVAGSAAIIDVLEAQFPEPALYPADPKLRSEALALQGRFDDEVGPASRSALFSVLVNEPAYLTSMFARKASGPARFAYRALFPIAKGLIARGNGVDQPDGVERAFRRFEQALDEVAKDAGGSGYLVGDTFSVADLTAASLLAPFANPNHPDMRRPEPMPADLAAVMARYKDHAALDWCRRIYADHRPV